MATPKQIRRRGRWSLILGTIFAFVAFAAVAYSSDVNVAVVDATAPTGEVKLAPGGSGNITINLSVTGNQAGTATFEVYRTWTLSGGAFVGSNPQEFTVAQRAGGDPPTTFSTTGTVSVASGQADGTFTLAVGAFDITNSNTSGGKLQAGSSSAYSVTVETPAPSDTTAPVITPNVVGTVGNNGWYTSNVSLSWSVVDSESAISSQSGCGAVSITADQAATTYTCTATSGGGTNSQSVTIKRDATAPSVGCASAPSSWSGDDVSIACTASDAPSGLASSGDASFNLTTSVDAGTETNNASTGSRSVSDNAGNSSVAGPVSGIKVDKKAPTFLCAAAPTAWSASDISINCTAADGGSALNPLSDANFVLSTSVASGTETSNASTGTKPLSDAVGNSVTAPAIAGLKVDKKGPSIMLSTPASGASYLLNQLVAASYSCSDGGSGVDTCIGTVASGSNINTASAGSKSFTVNAKDLVGNSAVPVVHNYGVRYDFVGFSAPVNNPNWINKLKAGQAVPFKWRLLDAHGAAVTNLAGATMGVGGLNCAQPDAEGFDAIEELAAGSSGLQNLGDGYYQLNWKSLSTYANSCRTVALNLGEGINRTAWFQFTK